MVRKINVPYYRTLEKEFKNFRDYSITRMREFEQLLLDATTRLTELERRKKKKST